MADNHNPTPQDLEALDALMRRALPLGEYHSFMDGVSLVYLHRVVQTARAEAQDEGAAGEPVAKVVRKGFSTGSISWTKFGQDADLSDETLLYAHPSPTPAADADRVLKPDLFWDAEGWEHTHHDLTEAYEEATGGTNSGVMKIGNALQLPSIWAVQIDIDTTGDGEADDYEIKTFPTKEEADAYLADALKSTAAKEGGAA